MRVQEQKRRGEISIALVVVLALIGALFGHDRAARGPLIQRVQQQRAVRAQQRQVMRQPVVIQVQAPKTKAPSKDYPPKAK